MIQKNYRKQNEKDRLVAGRGTKQQLCLCASWNLKLKENSGTSNGSTGFGFSPIIRLGFSVLAC